MKGRTRREWQLRAPDRSLVREIRESTGLSPTAATILANRGIAGGVEAGRFLSGTLRDIASPFLMNDLEKAALRLIEAGRRNEPVLIYADYDVDGATGAACLLLFLREAFPRLPVAIHQNHRVADGYGLHRDRVEAAAASGVKLLVTVDCGISDVDAIRLANARGMDVIVTDHHLPGPELPPAAAVLNPKRRDCGFPEKELAGVGVVFTLVRGMRDLMQGNGAAEREIDLRRYLDLVALGTVSDMVPLRGDNRILVKAGIREIRERPREGVSALLSVSGVDPGAANESDLGFRIGPRLNAAGRVGESRRSSEILVTGDRREAVRLAAELHADNARRQREEARILRCAEAALLSGPPADGRNAIVLADPDWHLGVLGIVASKLAERFHRPAVLLRVEGPQARGSCRSVDGFPLVDALGELSALLSRYGGHSQAAGVALPVENLEAFREGLDRIAGSYASTRESPGGLPVDAQVGLGDITDGFLEELERMRPFGMGNEEPMLLACGLRVTRKNPFGADGQHLKFEVAGGGRRLEATAFNRPGIPVEREGIVDLLFSPQRVTFRGTRRLRLLLRDVRPYAGGERSASAP
ncbi:MAG: single-stranded-DNA-specific exonuclease RecJ [Deltaproteobacteria bacterium]|nr:single-stranded-DNA-specific exonuclease RecJ [Candidatus Deferrimicrobiaceae bacterium]